MSIFIENADMAKYVDMALLFLLALFVVAPFTSIIPLVSYDETETSMSPYLADVLEAKYSDKTIPMTDFATECKNYRFGANNDLTCLDMSKTEYTFEELATRLADDSIDSHCMHLCHVFSAIHDTQVHRYEGGIGIFGVSRQCIYIEQKTGDERAYQTKENCHADHAEESDREDIDDSLIGDIGFFTCNYASGFAGAPSKCTKVRDDWCSANQGVGFTTLILILVFPIIFIIMECLKRNGKSGGMDIESERSRQFLFFIYVAVGAMMLWLAAESHWFANATPAECGFSPAVKKLDASDVESKNVVRGIGELGLGAMLLYVGVFLCLVRLVSMGVGMLSTTITQRASIYMYAVLVTLSIIAISTPFVTVVSQPLDAIDSIWSAKLYPFAKTDANNLFGNYMDGTCFGGFPKDPFGECNSPYEDICTETKTATIALVVLSGIGLIISGGTVMGRGITSESTFKMTHGIVLGLIMVWSLVHSIWMTYMVLHPLEKEGNDVKCGFNFMDGSDSGGMSLAATWSIFAVSTLSLVPVLWATFSGGQVTYGTLTL